MSNPLNIEPNEEVKAMLARLGIRWQDIAPTEEDRPRPDESRSAYIKRIFPMLMQRIGDALPDDDDSAKRCNHPGCEDRPPMSIERAADHHVEAHPECVASKAMVTFRKSLSINKRLTPPTDPRVSQNN